MKKVLLLGDSIRISYQPSVKAKLDGIAEVVGPEENCRFAKYTLWNIAAWINQLGKPDIIHWNNGTWDLYHQHDAMGIFTPLEEYILYIKRVLKELRRTGATIIWAATTPVNAKSIVCKNSEIDKYNAEVARYMAAERIEINDLNKIIKDNIELYIGEDHLHLSKQGEEICAAAVAAAIRKHL